MEILEAKGYAENDVNIRYYLGRCMEELEVDKRVTYGACDSCLRDILARQTKVRKVKRHNEAEHRKGRKRNKKRRRTDEILRLFLETFI